MYVFELLINFPSVIVLDGVYSGRRTPPISLDWFQRVVPW